MIPYQGQLLVVGGGYGENPSSRQAGSSYDERGFTNEVHSFNLTTGRDSVTLWACTTWADIRIFKGGVQVV